VLPAAFDYHRPSSLTEALRLLTDLGEDARPLAGGHSLIPAMKLRLARPTALVDLADVSELRAIDTTGDRISIGAMVTHGEILQSDALAKACPIFRSAAHGIGDLQVRNSGTIGGSLAHADPAADWPAVVLALDAELEAAAPDRRRAIGATEFFVDMLQTNLRVGEILCRILVTPAGKQMAYVKTEQKASGYALCGVAVAIDGKTQQTRIGVTGVSTVPYRAQAVERALEGRKLDEATIAEASKHAAEGATLLSDIHASADFRAHLAQVNTARALRQALAQ
jgi:aerobic carbon-monoxide dehydrogenase medium subunit